MENITYSHHQIYHEAALNIALLDSLCCCILLNEFLADGQNNMIIDKVSSIISALINALISFEKL